MTSPLTWLDSSSSSRRRALEVIKLFEEKGTVDEIGIGSVRDALSDVLFPGTSVLHTRARYFLLIPWMYRHLEARKVESATVAKVARKFELGLIEPLLESEDHDGTVGRMARGSLKLLPSTMYWNGLHAWGVKLHSTSQDQYHRSLDRFYRRTELGHSDDDGNPLSGSALRNWHAGLPSPPPGFPKGPLSLGLSRLEAEYLRERILTRCPGTLLAHLVDRCQPAEEVAFVWEHPERGGFTALNSTQLNHAQNFAEAIHGAALLYNLMLSEKGNRTARAEEYRDDFEGWSARTVSRGAALSEWRREEFWTLVTDMNPRIPVPTRVFVDAWLDLALAGDPTALHDLPRARRLISDRERAIKGPLARLHNPDALNRWRGSSGAGQLTFRWDPQVRRLTADIQLGLGKDA
jgi:hypothetical protein